MGSSVKLGCVVFVLGCGSVSSNNPDASPDTSMAARWPAGWQYCKEITVGGAFPDDYSHKLQLTAAEIPAGHARGALEDVRFYLGACGSDDDTQTPLPMWIETAGGGTGTLWTRTPVASNATLLAMYYGKDSAPTVSNGSETFPFFDDFDGSALDATKWDLARSASSSTNCTDTITVALGKLTLEQRATVGYPETCVRDVISKTTFQPTGSYGIGMELKGLQYPNWGGLGAGAGGFRAAAGGFLDGATWPMRANTGYLEASEQGFYLTTSASSVSSSSGDKSAMANPTVAGDVRLNWTTSSVTWTSNGTMIATNTSNVATIPLNAQLEVASWDTSLPTGKIVLDRITVMRTVPTAPTYVFGSEKMP